MPIVLTAVNGADFRDMGRVLLNPHKTLRLAGREHGRAIPLPDVERPALAHTASD
jgi:hypothetical protein